MWQRSTPSNQTNLTHQHNTLRDEDSPSDPPISLTEETLEFQVEYPQEEVEEVEEAEEEAEVEEEGSLLQYQHSKQLPMEETNSSAIRHLYLQEIARNQKRS